MATKASPFKALALITSLLLLTACSPQEAKPVENDIDTVVTNVNIPKPTVLTTFYPLEYFASQIAKDNVEVVNLASETHIHDYIPSSQDIAEISNANLVLFQSYDLESWMLDLKESLDTNNVNYLEVDPNNSHSWLDPKLALNIVENIMTSLIEVDPTRSKEYMENAKDLKDKLSELDKRYENQLKDCKIEEVIISHDVFISLQDEYGLNFKPIQGNSHHHLPSIKSLAALGDAHATESSYILTEENYLQDYAQTLATEYNLELLTIYPIENDSKEYFAAMNANLDNIKTAFQCQ